MKRISKEEFDKLCGPLPSVIMVVGRPLGMNTDKMLPYNTPEERKRVDEAYARLLKGRTTEEYFFDMLDEANREKAEEKKKEAKKH
jgi:hypothetical protein